MSTTRTSTAAVGAVSSAGVHGRRVLIDFAPKPGSTERLYAGVVSCLSTGEVRFRCALDERKAEHAFGSAGKGLWYAARALCESLAEHWESSGDCAGWTPPFESAKLATAQAFSARDQDTGNLQLLTRVSSMHTLMNEYEIPVVDRSKDGVVMKVRSAIRRDVNSRHLQARFRRELHVGEDGTMKVDFLGQNFACYFLQLTQSHRGIEPMVDRASGRLFQLQALKRFVKSPPRQLGLLEDERPQNFELLMVGSNSDPVQRRVINMVTALADRSEIRTRPLGNIEAAAEHVFAMERRA